MQEGRTATLEDRERALRMLALQIIGQLPADQEEANRVLDLARDVLNDFLHVQRNDPYRGLRCVT